MRDGFLGYNTTFMLDVVVCALLLVVPAVIYSLWLVKARFDYRRHRNVQLALGAILLVTVAAFEIDLQIVHGGWRNVVDKRDPPLSAEQLAFVARLLRIHLVFAISTPFLWAATIWLALRRMPNPPAPSAHSPLHKKLGWLSVADLVLTSLTGLLFYYYAFVA